METLFLFFLQHRLLLLFLPYLWGMETFWKCVFIHDASISSYRTYEEWKPSSRRFWISSLNSSFLPYLWGMETSSPGHQYKRTSVFLPYLWGMETMKIRKLMKLCLSSYRTYEEWKLPSNNMFGMKDLVLTVPMRNGNLLELWKMLEIGFVLTVPMRNGNSFLTSSFKSFFKVLTVPMRNGNFWWCVFILSWLSVLTVPMRNGNFLPAEILSAMFFRSYRTYEEWKLSVFALPSPREFRSYRTYEEWKLVSHWINPSKFFCVLTVPMRNGNSE